MKKKKAKKKLEKMVKGSIWKDNVMDLNELMYGDEKISDTLEGLDDVKYFVDDINTYAVDECKVVYYGVNADKEERCINALIVMHKKQPLAIGYTED